MLRIWFLNVGHGDCTIIQHPSGRLTMIDINDSATYDPQSQKELIAEQAAVHIRQDVAAVYAASEAAREVVDPVAFFKDNFPRQSLWRFILTHPDMDHMRGIKRLFAEVNVVNFWDTKNTKPTPSFWKSGDKADWEFYQSRRASARNYTRDVFAYALNQEEDGSVGGDGIAVLSPSPALVRECNDKGKWNDLSIAILVRYAGRTCLFPGDAEAPAWTAMLENYGDGLKADLFKASHHGRDSGYYLPAVQAIAPEVVVTSVGRKPSTDAHQKYAYHAELALSTRYYGNIHVEISPTGSWKIVVDRNAP